MSAERPPEYLLRTLIAVDAISLASPRRAAAALRGRNVAARVAAVLEIPLGMTKRILRAIELAARK